MINSRADIFNNIRIWIGNEITKGSLVFDSLEPFLVDDKGRRLDKNEHAIFYELDYEIETNEDKIQSYTQMSDSAIIRLVPKLVTTRPYMRSATEFRGDIHPTSSKGWYGRLIRGERNALYIIQELRNSNQFWLTVLDPGSNTILECHKVQRYEIDVLRLIDSFEHFNSRIRFFGEGTDTEIRERILRVLDETTLSWQDIYNLSHGIGIPSSLARGKTSRETLVQMFPVDTYSEETREEVLAFLAWTVKENFPTDDLVDFVESLGGMPTFRALLVHHLRIVLDGKSVPPYSALAWSAARGDDIPRLAIEETQLQKPNVVLRYKVFEKAPNWQAEAVPILKVLDSSDEITLVLPKSKRTLSTNRRRFLISSMGFSLRAYVHPMNVGLRNIVYLGSKYRWAHQHLAYSLSLRAESGPTLYLQSIIVPPLAAERIKSVFPQAHSIGWSGSSTNYNLFKEKQCEWTINSKIILKSPERGITLQALKKKFGGINLISSYHLTRKDAKIIDMINSTVFYLTHLEKEKGQQYWNTTEKEAKRILANLQNTGVVDISYRFNMGGEFIRVAVIVEGQPKSVYSISDALLKGCPTTRTLISDDGSFSINTSRIPIEMRDVFFEDLPKIANENGVTVRPYTVSGFRNYEGSLYQRIIRDDGTYDDDITNFLSQIELLPEFQDESNY